jgi:hypothetical protein
LGLSPAVAKCEFTRESGIQANVRLAAIFCRALWARRSVRTRFSREGQPGIDATELHCWLDGMEGDLPVLTWITHHRLWALGMGFTVLIVAIAAGVWFFVLRSPATQIDLSPSASTVRVNAQGLPAVAHNYRRPVFTGTEPPVASS